MCSEEAEALAKRLKLRFYRTSVKEDLNVNEGKLPFKATYCKKNFILALLKLCCLEIIFIMRTSFFVT